MDNDTFNVNSNGAFTFATAVDDGSPYAVTVSMQPTNPAQKCEVSNGAGTATANVTNVTVDCGHNEWTWMGGSDLANQAGIYGTLGTPTSTNAPGARSNSAVWMDASGNFWLFSGLDESSNRYNDLWNSVRESGLGWAAQTFPTRRGSMERWVLHPPPTCQGHALRL